jgi:hypothetical protein
MDKTTYNGWPNYATWRVNLELIADDEGWQEWIEDNHTDGSGKIDDDDECLYELTKAIEEHCESILTDHCGCDGMSLAVQYALAFINDVSWWSIAKHQIEQFKMDNE